MFEFHRDKVRYFEMQRQTAAAHVVPLVMEALPKRQARVLEIGCAEAGVLKAFIDVGCTGVGIELEESRANTARGFLTEDIMKGRVEIRTDNIYEVDPVDFGEEGFDVIVLKDVIEHIPDQERMIPRLTEFLAPGGVIFFGFPPWQMPFGGHQQIAHTKWVTRVPWLHLLPERLYAAYVHWAGEPEHIREELANIRSTRITLERFERIVANAGLSVRRRKLWLFNPIYALKFGVEARELPVWLSGLPVVRNFYTTAAFYLVGHALAPVGRVATEIHPASSPISPVQHAA